MAERVCPQCEQVFVVTGKGSARKRFCGPECWKASRPLCSFEGCVHQVQLQELCSSHYRQKKKGASLRALKVQEQKIERTCANVECGRKFFGYKHGHVAIYCSTLCRNRAIQQRSDDRVVPLCTHPDGCDRRAVSRGLCSLHYTRFRETGDLGPAGSKQITRKGGWYVGRVGYVVRDTANGTETQHRVVMEQIIGRPLLRIESVHHKNGQRADNRPENLELWSKAQPAGQRVSDKVAWAIELLALYQPEVLNPKGT